MKYYYTGIEEIDHGDDTTGIKPSGEIPPNLTVLRYDPPTRFVVDATPENPPASWDEKTAVEVESDYPGLLGGE